MARVRGNRSLPSGLRPASTRAERYAFALVLLGLLPSCSRWESDRKLSDPKQAAIAASGLPSRSVAAKPPSSPASAVSRASAEPASPSHVLLPPGKLRYVQVSVGAVGPTSHGNMVLLLDPDKRRAVPVFIGESEAFSIRLRLSRQHYPRPLTHDLLDSMLVKLGGKVEQVRVERVEEGAFVATVVLTRAGEVSELDARTSDAIALALGNRAPIMMAEEVLQSAALDLDRLPKITPPDEPLPSPASEPAGSSGVEM